MIDRRKLKLPYKMIIEGATFPSDALAGGTRESETAWVADDNIVVEGTLEQLLVFALMNFDVQSVQIAEKFDIVSARRFRNLSAAQNISVVSVDPTVDPGPVTAADLTFVANLTNNYRYDWNQQVTLVVETAAGEKTFYKGSVLAALCYALQYDGTAAPIYVNSNFALYDGGVPMGVTVLNLHDANQAPVQLHAAHIKLAQRILDAPQ